MHLPDINSWIALAHHTHQHHPSALAWYQQHGHEGMVFCRITQQGFLRLSTNKAVFPQSVLSLSDAWRLYDQIRSYPSVSYREEPVGLESKWRSITQSSLPSTKLWTDAYLAAFAMQAGLEIISFDAGFRQFPGLACTILV